MFRGPDFSVKIDGEFYTTSWVKATAFMSLMRMGQEDTRAFYTFMRNYLLADAAGKVEPPLNGFLDFDESILKGEPVVFDKEGRETDFYNQQYDQWRKRLQA